MKKIAFTIAVLSAIILFGGSENVRAQSGSMQWSGTVDDTVRVIVKNRRATTNTISGSRTYNARADFNGRLPRTGSRVWVNKTNGRGKINVIQQPNRRNGYTAIIQIVDNKGGRDNYGFTLSWD